MALRQRKVASLAEFETRAAALLKEVEALKDPTHSVKRVYHSKLELLRMDIAEHVQTLDMGKDAKASVGKKEEEPLSPERKALNELDQKLAAAEEPLSLISKKNNGPLVILDFIALMIYTFGIAMPLMWCVVPLRLLHPLLRKLGVHNNYLPVDMSTKLFAIGFVAVSGTSMVVEGAEHVDKRQNYVCMFTHASNLDPWAVQAGCSTSFKWIGKKVLFMIPIFGWLMSAQGHFAIDRSNQKRAIETLDSVVRAIHKYKRSIAISPEGTRARKGQLGPFKKGPFHTTVKTRLPVLPVVVINAYERWPPGQLAPSPGTIVIRYLKPLDFPDTAEVHDLINPVRRVILEATDDISKVPEPEAAGAVQTLFSVLLNIMLLFVPYLWYMMFQYVMQKW
eukprot:comp18809_c0_seq1/m.20765 comp18809_c0_seq1/g.20765  ORF comp18809_c0_seq1/g.20765 comp18809_c0_seq1/m.20765 type:complete len:393 (-) comp18809_c0_seq1:902-2080(-)